MFTCYIILAITLVVALFLIPRTYIKMENKEIATIQTEIPQILENDVEITEPLDQLVAEHSMEIVVYKGTEVAYTTVPGVDIQNFRFLINEKQVSFKEQYQLDTASGAYTVSYAIYHIDALSYLQQLMTWLTIFVMLMIFILLTVIGLMRFDLIKPLQQIKQVLLKVKSGADINELAINTDTGDVVTKDFNKFMQRVSDVSQDYTALEIQLQFEKEKLQNFIAMSRAFVHDLKTPLHQTLLENGNVKQRVKGKGNDELELILDYNIDRTDLVLQEINEIVSLYDTSPEDFKNKKDAFDLVKTFYQTLQVFSYFLSEKDLTIESDVPEELWIYTNKVAVKNIFHNMLSNACKYAKEDTEIDVVIEENQEVVSLQLTNESTEHNIKRLEATRHQFAGFDDADVNEDQAYSSGVGLHILRELSEYVGGTYTFIIDGTYVTTIIEIPKEEGVDDE